MLTLEEVHTVLDELGDWSLSWDARARNALCFTSVTLTPKMRSLPKVWQSPKTCLLLGEMEGKDSTDNLRNRMGPFWHEIQELYDGQQVSFAFGGVKLSLTVRLTFPADMCAHWALFTIGGRAQGLGHVCLHCYAKYKDLGKVFCHHLIKVSTLAHS